MESLDIYSLLQVVRHNATTVYSYITQGRQERSFNYRGEDLFRQKATLLYEETDQVTMEIVVATRTLELWLLEDMSLAVVSCVSVNYDHDGLHHAVPHHQGYAGHGQRAVPGPGRACGGLKRAVRPGV